MNKLATLAFGEKACSLATAYFFVESEQMFDEEDPVDHEILFKKVANKTPRLIG